MASFEEVPTGSLNEWLPMFDNGTRAWSSGQRPWRMNPIFDNIIPHSCAFCRRGIRQGVKLSKCGCNIVFYCCKAHRTAHQNIHTKVICEAMQGYTNTYWEEHDFKTLTLEAYQTYLKTGFSIMNDYIKQNSSPTDETVNPLLKMENRNSWLQQRHCSVCFKPGCLQDTLLTDCLICAQAAHCPTEECKNAFTQVHDNFTCERYLVGVCALIMSMQQGKPLLSASRGRVTTDSWQLPKAWGPYIERKNTEFEVPPQLLTMPPVMAMLTEGLSVPWTMLHTLFKLYGAGLMTKTELEIHVVGPDVAELIGREYRYEEIMHWLPNLTDLRITFIGPTLPPNATDFKACNTCPQCSELQCQVRMRMFRGLYHQAVAGQLVPTDAHLVYVGHSGMHEIISLSGIVLKEHSEKVSEEKVTTVNPDSNMLARANMLKAMWIPTIQTLIRADVPCVFTGFNATHMAQEQFLLHSVGAKVIGKSRRNPFRGLRPHRELFQEGSFYHHNCYYVVIKGSRIMKEEVNNKEESTNTAEGEFAMKHVPGEEVDCKEFYQTWSAP